jgi:hypothetical protein
MSSLNANDPTFAQSAPALHPPDAAPARTLSDAVAAVTEHCRRTEMRRVRFTDAFTTMRNNAVTVPRGMFDAMQANLRVVDTLARTLQLGPLVLVAFDAAAPHAVREPAVQPHGAQHEAFRRGEPLPHWFSAADEVRVQQALLKSDSDQSLTVELRGAGESGQRHLLRLLAPDASQPDLRWACLVCLPHDTLKAERPTRRAPPKSPQRPRPEAWPLQAL